MPSSVNLLLEILLAAQKITLLFLYSKDRQRLGSWLPPPVRTGKPEKELLH